MSLVGLDIGTTGCKAVAITTNGTVLGKAGREYALSVPRPGWAELQTEEVWQAVRAVIRQVTTLTPSDPIEAISVSAMSDTVAPVDQNLEPVCHDCVV